jgi:DUF4097 and DUF4098 domain-containing protein YvlB
MKLRLRDVMFLPMFPYDDNRIKKRRMNRLENKKKVFIWVALICIVAVLFFNLFYNREGKSDFAITQDFSNVAVESDNAELLFIPSDGKEAKVELNSSAERDYTVDVKVKNDTLEIDVERKWFKWFSFHFFSKTPTVSILLPAKEYGTIKGETDNGTLKASGIQAKEFVGQTDNGEVILKEMTSESIFAEADNGNVYIENSTGEIFGQTSNGNLLVIADRLDRAMELETDNGEIFIQTEKEPKDVKIDVRTDNGYLNIFGKANTETVIGNGKNLVKLTSDNGSITIE